jgi:uncharacterized membrane protein YtjA (UPF0391 family)
MDQSRAMLATVTASTTSAATAAVAAEVVHVVFLLLLLFRTVAASETARIEVEGVVMRLLEGSRNGGSCWFGAVVMVTSELLDCDLALSASCCKCRWGIVAKLVVGSHVSAVSAKVS